MNAIYTQLSAAAKDLVNLSPLTEFVPGINHQIKIENSSQVWCHKDADISRLKGRLANNSHLFIGASKVSGLVDLNHQAGMYIGHKTDINSIFLTNFMGAGMVVIGDEVGLNGGTYHIGGSTRLIIGDTCMVASNAVFRTTDGHAIFDRNTRERLNYDSDIIIHPHVWIGVNSTVWKGTDIGTGVMVGTGSFVHGILEPNCLYVGRPARLLKKNIVWSKSFNYRDIPDVYK
jgi:acetyltransferase-like isoleucine patch superfamily enzyme